MVAVATGSMGPVRTGRRPVGPCRRERLTGELPERGQLDPGLAHADAHGDGALWRGLCALPRRQRAVLVLRYYEHREDAGIATLLGISRGTVRSQAALGLEKLRASGGLRRGPRHRRRRGGDPAGRPAAATAARRAARRAHLVRDRAGLRPRKLAGAGLAQGDPPVARHPARRRAVPGARDPG